MPLLDQAAQAAHRRVNLFHSLILLGGMGAVLLIANTIIWGAAGVAATALILVGIALLAPRVPPRTVMNLYRATLVPQNESQLSSLLDVLAWRAGLPKRPELYVIPSMTMNAFATGTPQGSAIGVTEGLLRRLSMREIAGVLAHELSHIRNNDLFVMGLADVVTRILQAFSYVALALAVFNLGAMLSSDETVSWIGILALYVAPALSSLLQLGLSRTREFDADLEAAALTGDPLGLASALRQLDTYTGHFWEDLMFPVPARRVPVPSLLRTHPDTSERIRRLVSLTGAPEFEPITIVEQPMVTLVGYGPGDMRPRYRWPGLWY